MARLVLLNGLPGIGKSTLARQYVADHPLALNLDIDSIRMSFGQWETHDESKHLARALAADMAQGHLRRGHDVVVPQLLARVDFIEALASVARDAGADFVEVLLVADGGEAWRRFRRRRDELESAGEAHPVRLADLDRRALAETATRLGEIVRARPSTRVVDTTSGDVAAASGALRLICDGGA